MIASVSGSVIWIVVPWPGVDSTSTVPPSFSMFVRTTSMPTPRPLTSVIFSAVEKPGWKISRTVSRSPMRPACSAVMTPFSTAFCLSFDGIDAAAVVGDVDPHLAGLVVGPQRDRALGLLAGGGADFRRLDAVVDRVAHQVGERIADRFEDRLVDFDFLAVHDDVALLAELGAQVADHAGKLAEDGADRLHARPHDRFLQLGRDLVEPRGDGVDARRVARR